MQVNTDGLSLIGESITICLDQATRVLSALQASCPFGRVPFLPLGSFILVGLLGGSHPFPLECEFLPLLWLHKIAHSHSGHLLFNLLHTYSFCSLFPHCISHQDIVLFSNYGERAVSLLYLSSSVKHVVNNAPLLIIRLRAISA